MRLARLKIDLEIGEANIGAFAHGHDPNVQPQRADGGVDFLIRGDVDCPEILRFFAGEFVELLCERFGVEVGDGFPPHEGGGPR